jgi:hypothetical protein
LALTDDSDMEEPAIPQGHVAVDDEAPKTATKEITKPSAKKMPVDPQGTLPEPISITHMGNLAVELDLET